MAVHVITLHVHAQQGVSGLAQQGVSLAVPALGHKWIVM